MSTPDVSPIGRALGRIPSGLFIVTTLADGRASGFLGSLVMQTGFEPPTVAVAIGSARPQLEHVRKCGAFALSILHPQSRPLMTPFVRKLEEHESPFDGLALAKTPRGLSVLSESLAWIECRVIGEHATGDHVVVFGEVSQAAILHEGEPCTHVRKNGLRY
jgi:flavin reductase (DIM6/NTAB) family NADH-FMN oxidoreductase RutF